MLHEFTLPLMDTGHKALLPQDFNSIQKSDPNFYKSIKIIYIQSRKTI